MNSLSEKFDALSIDSDKKHNENIQRLTAIETNQIHFNDRLDDLERKLFGNGQPGVLTVIQNRISNLEKWFWRASGAIGLILVILRFVEVIKK